MSEAEDHLHQTFMGRRAQALATEMRRGSFWTTAFLNAGEDGAKFAAAFVKGREDLLEMTIMAFENAEHPTVIGFGRSSGAMALHRWAGVQARVHDLDSPNLRLAAHLGQLMDVSPDLVADVKNWLASPEGESSRELASNLGGPAYSRLTPARAVVDIAPYDDGTPGLSFGLKD